jgi:glyoxylase-like metal-dependent hydrolase (beta-lactamase superfamily II)
MTFPALVPDVGFIEIADRCFVSRQSWVDVNIGLVAGSAGVVVVDTHASEAAGNRIADEVAAMGLGEVLAVVNTHEHWDHAFGNAALTARWPGAALVAHEAAAGRMSAAGAAFQASYDASAPFAEEVRETNIVVPDTTFSSVHLIDLGDRVVELLYPGRGHTSGDLLVRVPDTDVLFVGDLVEESGPPAYGEECFPLDWPGSLDFTIGLLTDRSTVVPGHGALVGKGFVEEQRSAIGVVAETIRDRRRAASPRRRQRPTRPGRTRSRI